MEGFGKTSAPEVVVDFFIFKGQDAHGNRTNLIVPHGEKFSVVAHDTHRFTFGEPLWEGHLQGA